MDTWKYLIIFILATITSSNSSKRLNQNHHPDRNVNTNTVCGNTAGLTGRQSQLCSNHPHSVASAIQGMQIAIHECKVQFKNHKWNCSSLDTRNKIPQTSGFLKYANGIKESAFAFAIASAGVVHQVAHACSLGKIKECECQQSPPKLTHLTASQRKKVHKHFDTAAKSEMKRHTQSFERTGCSHNINFGMEFAVKFLDSREESDFVAKIRSHNNRVGRLIVANNMKENCRCHGQSGSCSMKTCWRETPDFKAVGKEIKRKYEEAKRVSQSDFGNEARMGNDIASGGSFEGNDNINVQDLLYYDHSPDYCRPHRRINVAGTTGRICNHTAGADEQNSCDNLCCNRGFTTHTVKRVEPCRCRFHWCCYVDCEQCEWEETISVCN